MSELNSLNEFRSVANMIHSSRKLSDSTKNKFKYLFLEGMIKFLKMYAVNELGNQVDLDLYRIALYVNSVKFENEEVYYIKNLDDIFNILTYEVLNGYPVWRFLKLSDNQLRYLESEYNSKLDRYVSYLYSLKNCQTCYYYQRRDTPFGVLEKCLYSKDKWSRSRSGSFDSSKIKNCTHYSRTVPEDESILFNSGSVKEIKGEDLDNYRLNNKDIIELENNKNKWSKLDELDKSIASIGLMMSGKRAITDIEKDSLNAEKFSILYQFMEIHAQIEYGEAYEPNVSKIASDIYSNKFSGYSTKSKFIKGIESNIINDYRWANKYIKKVKV